MLYYRKFPLAKKFIDKKGESIKIFPSEVYCLIVLRSFVKKPLSGSLILGVEKIYDERGYVRVFCRTFLVLQYRKLS